MVHPTPAEQQPRPDLIALRDTDTAGVVVTA